MTPTQKFLDELRYALFWRDLSKAWRHNTRPVVTDQEVEWLDAFAYCEPGRTADPNEDAWALIGEPS